MTSAHPSATAQPPLRLQPTSPWRRAGRAATFTLGMAMLAAVVAVFLVPVLTGGASLTVLTGSMTPTFSPGDVLAVRGIEQSDVCADVRVGTVISYLPRPNDPTLITHRVVEKTAGEYPDGTSCRLVTQGDANSAADEAISPAQVRGVLLYSIPKLGWARQWVADNMIAAGIASAVVALAWWFVTGRRPRTRIYTVSSVDASAAETSAGAEHEEDLHLRDAALRKREADLLEREADLRDRELSLP